MLMAEFEPRTPGVGINLCVKCAKTIATSQ